MLASTGVRGQETASSLIGYEHFVLHGPWWVTGTSSDNKVRDHSSGGVVDGCGQGSGAAQLSCPVINTKRGRDAD